MVVVYMSVGGRHVPGSSSGGLGHLQLVVVDLGLAVVCPSQTSSSIGFLL